MNGLKSTLGIGDAHFEMECHLKLYSHVPLMVTEFVKASLSGEFAPDLSKEICTQLCSYINKINTKLMGKKMANLHELHVFLLHLI